MLHIKIVAVGKIKEKYLKEGIKEYSKRLGAYVKFQMIEVDDEPCSEKHSLAEMERVKQKEGIRLLKHIEEQDYLILLDLQGRGLSSLQFAEMLATRSLAGQSKIAIIGGRWEFQLRSKKERIMFEFLKLTFPHQLFRLILLEQIYRACKINHGETYHK